MAAVTAAVLGATATAVTMGMSFGQAAKQKKAQREANAAAEKAIGEAEKMLGVNYYKGLSIQKEPYELEREANLVSGAQAIEAGVESERGAAATAGRVQMAQQAGQRQIAAAMGQEMAGLEKLTAEEESRLRDAKAQIELQRAAGAQQAAADAAKAAAQATQQGMQSVVSLGSQLAEQVPLYQKTAGVKAENQFNKLAENQALAPDYQGKTFQQAISMQPGYESIGKMNALQFQDWQSKQDRNFWNKFNWGPKNAVDWLSSSIGGQ